MIIMHKEYDFSKGERGKFYNQNGSMNLPIYLEADVLNYFSEKAKNKGIELNQIVNDMLKHDIALIEGIR